MKIHSIYRSPEYADQYTVYYKGRGTLWLAHTMNKKFRMCRCMSTHPCHPQGIGIMGDGLPGKHNGKKITFEELPEDCQKLVLRDLEG